MRGKAAKTKRVSSPDDLENEYYKPTRPKKSENSENGENQNPGENRLVQVSYPELKKKGYLTETNPSLNNIEEEEEKNNSEHHKKVIIKKAKPSNFEKLSLADVLDCKFTPENIHFRDKEISEILTFIAE